MSTLFVLFHFLIFCELLPALNCANKICSPVIIYFGVIIFNPYPCCLSVADSSDSKSGMSSNFWVPSTIVLTTSLK